MSLKCSSTVWDKSKQSKTGLLFMLAIADFADDDNFCWPGQQLLANRVRTTTRTISTLASSAREDGELWYARRGSIPPSNVYVILIDITPNQLANAVRKASGWGCDVSELEAILNRFPKHEEISCLKPEARLHDKPEARLHDKHEVATSCDPSLDPSLDPSAASAKRPTGKRTESVVSRALRGTLTRSEDEHEVGNLAGFIGQQLNSPVPSGQANKLAMTFTEFAQSGRITHDSPEQLWMNNHQFRNFVIDQVDFWKKQSDTSANKRRKCINTICNYKHAYGWFAYSGYTGPQLQVPRTPTGSTVIEKVDEEWAKSLERIKL